MNEPAYPMRVIHDLLIPMRDGVRLAANLYLPDSPEIGQAPALVQYTPYLKDGRGGRGHVETGQLYFARRGYACLNLDMRGFGCSEGIPAPPFSESEKQDGFDALAWIAAQPWCNGRTGMWGLSYGGNTALAVASLQPPSLGAIVPIHATDDDFLGTCYPHGCRGGHVGEIEWGFRMLGYELLPPLRFDAEGRWQRLWAERLEAAAPRSFTWHTLPPSAWAGWRTDVEAIRAPTYLVSAWQDCFPGETLRNYARLAAPKRALIGPWKHEFPDRATHHPIGFWHEMRRWWDHWLKGIDTGLMDESPLIVFERGGQGWRCETAWPPERASGVEYFLNGDGHLGPDRPGGGPPAADTYRADPTVGLNHLPWDWTTPTPPGPADIAPDDHRALTYTTPPLTEGLTIAGDVDLLLYLSADQSDFPLAAWLSDVAPNGFSTLICQGWVRPAHIAGGPLVAGRVYKIPVPFNPTSWRVPPGHGLRVAVAGACFPAIVPAPANPVLAVHRSEQYPSRLHFSAAPAGDGPGAAPAFQPPVDVNPPAYLLDEGEHRISRDLLDRMAAYSFQRRAEYALEAGATLRIEIEAKVSVEKDAPRTLLMQGRQSLVVERPGAGPIVVRAEAHETYDNYRIAAEIVMDGRVFLKRTWEVDLSQAEWRWRV